MNLDQESPSAIFHAAGSRVELPPTRIATADLMNAGRRVRRRRRLAASGAGVLTMGIVAVTAVTVSAGTGRPGPGKQPMAVAGASTPASQGTTRSCTVEQLPLPTGATAAEVAGGAPSGQFLVGNTYTAGSSRPVLWNGDEVTAILVDAASAEAQGVNDSGVVVGEGTRAGRQFGWAYVNGRVTELPTPAGYTSAEANAVNARGEVVGIAWAAGRPSTAVVWRGLGGDVQVQRLAAPGSALAFGISDTGVVVGELEGKGAYAWDSTGQGRKLAGPTGSGRARGVRGDWAYGTAGMPRPHQTPSAETSGTGTPAGAPQVIRPNAVLWNFGTNQAIEVAGGGVGAVTSIGESVVNTDDGKAAVRGTDGALRPLPDLTVNGASHAAVISDDGTVVAGSFQTNAQSPRPVRWHC